MSQTQFNDTTSFFLSNLAPNDRYLFSELSAPPLSKIGDHLIYVLDDNKLYYDGQEVATGASGGDVSSGPGVYDPNYVAVFSDDTGKIIKQADIDTTDDNLSINGIDKTINMRNQVTDVIQPIIRKHHKSLNLGFNSGSTSLNNDCVTIGYNAGNASEGGTGAVCIGVDSAKLATDTTSNLTAVGYNSASVITTGSDNTFIGSSSALNLESGDNNIIIGSAAGSDLVSGDNNIYIGSVGGAVPSEVDTIRIGEDGNHNRVFMAGIYGINNGPQFSKLVCADSNLQIQDSSIFSRVEGFTGVMSNTISGLPSMSAGVTYLVNYGIGNLTNAVSATSDVLYGNNILASATTLCDQNVCVGNNILYGCLANTSNNVCLGKDIGIAAANGVQQNTLIGNSTGQGLNLGVRNTALGFGAGSNLTNNQRCMYLDSAGVNGESNVIRVGTVGTHDTLYLAGVTSSSVSNKKAVVMDSVTGKIGYENQMMMIVAESYFENYVSPYVRTTTINVPAEIAYTGTLISNMSMDFDVSVPGRLKWLGADTIQCHAAFSLSANLATGVNDNFSFHCAVDGVKVPGSEIRRRMSNSVTFEMITWHKVVTLSTNQYLSCFTTNLSASNSLNFGNCNTVIMSSH